MPEPIPMLGLVFGRLTVVAQAPTFKGVRMWLCRCECGGETTVQGQALRSGSTRSCGCLYRETRGTSKNLKHGHAIDGEWHPLYGIWIGIKTRCDNPNSKSWSHYGALGVTVCQRWRDSFESFLEDMGPRPAGTSIDRIDPFGNYEPSNCRWATQLEQARNRKSNLDTHCSNNHEWTEESTWINPATGMRNCLTCRHESNRRHREKRRNRGD